MDEIKRPRRAAVRDVNPPQPVANQRRTYTVTAAAPAPVMEPAATPGKQRGKMVLNLPESDGRSDRHHVPMRVKRRISKAWSLGMRAVIIIVVIIFSAFGTLAWRAYENAHKVFKGTAKTVAALQTAPAPNLLKGEGDGRINILLLGIGGPNHDGSDLTDTLMLASIDPVNHKAALLSVPRDMWVTPSGQGSEKINAVYPLAKYAYMSHHKADANDPRAIQAGLTAIDQEFENVTGVPVNYNALVNFQAFKQGVDAVGGVTIDVPTDLYDPTMAWENHNNPYLARAGVQQMTGEQALLYARSRETSSDFARNQRQRALLLALKEKAVSLGVLANPAKISNLLNAFGDNVYTDLSISDASRLYSIFKQITNNNIQSLSLAGDTSITSGAAGVGSLITTGNINGQSVVMPKAGLGNFSAIQAYVRQNLPDGYLVKEHARVLVVNGSGVDGAAAAMAQTLKEYGYNVVGTANADDDGWYPETQVINLAGKKYPYTKHYLEQRYSVTAANRVPQGVSTTRATADFVVVLGENEGTTH